MEKALAIVSGIFIAVLIVLGVLIVLMGVMIVSDSWNLEKAPGLDGRTSTKMPGASPE